MNSWKIHVVTTKIKLFLSLVWDRYAILNGVFIFLQLLEKQIVDLLAQLLEAPVEE